MKKWFWIVAIALGCVAVAVAVVNGSRQHAFTFSKSPLALKTSTDQPPQPAPAASTAGEWPQWRGPNRDGRSACSELLSDWPADGPPLLWTVRGLGRGMSSVSVAAGRIVTLGDRGAGGLPDGAVHGRRPRTVVDQTGGERRTERDTYDRWPSGLRPDVRRRSRLRRGRDRARAVAEKSRGGLRRLGPPMGLQRVATGRRRLRRLHAGRRQRPDRGPAQVDG